MKDKEKRKNMYTIPLHKLLGTDIFGIKNFSGCVVTYNT
jgi:hypothetical protein